jgi:hypothetical protein
MAPVPRYSNFILRSGTRHLSSCRDVTYQLSITVEDFRSHPDIDCGGPNKKRRAADPLSSSRA